MWFIFVLVVFIVIAVCILFRYRSKPRDCTFDAVYSAYGVNQAYASGREKKLCSQIFCPPGDAEAARVFNEFALRFHRALLRRKWYYVEDDESEEEMSAILARLDRTAVDRDTTSDVQ